MCVCASKRPATGVVCGACPSWRKRCVASGVTKRNAWELRRGLVGNSLAEGKEEEKGEKTEEARGEAAEGQRRAGSTVEPGGTHRPESRKALG